MDLLSKFGLLLMSAVITYSVIFCVRLFLKKIYKRIADPNEPIRVSLFPWQKKQGITSGDSFRQYMEQQGYTYSDNIIWSETYARYMTMDELRRLNKEEEKIDIKPKKESIRHHFTGLPWE
jgi:hypothetical protein